MLLLVFLRYVLSVDLGNFLLVSLTVLLGTITGISLGNFVGIVFRGSINKVESAMAGVLVLLSAMAGLMNQYVKHLTTSYITNLLIMLLFGLVFIILSLVINNKKQQAES